MISMKNSKGKIIIALGLMLAVEIVPKGEVVIAKDGNFITQESRKLLTDEIVVEKPRDFKAEVKGVEVILSWKAPENRNGLTGYTIYKDGKVIVELDSTDSNYKVKELNSNTLYGFKIVSNYSNGQSSKPISLSVRTEMVKAKVRNFNAVDIMSDKLTLSWDKPEHTAGLQGYSIYKDGKLLVELDSTRNKYQVTELANNTIYGFKIVGKYKNGTSKPVSINIRTKKANTI